MHRKLSRFKTSAYTRKVCYFCHFLKNSNVQLIKQYQDAIVGKAIPHTFDVFLNKTIDADK